jgi:uncharacterized protein (TIGR03503 family)
MNFSKGINRYIISLAIVFLLSFSAQAQADSLNQVPKDKLSVVLLMDSSASMLVNDPSRLRVEGAKLLLQFLKTGDSLAVVNFDQEASVIRPLTPFSADQIPSLLSQLNSLEARGQYTDLNAGLLKAIELLKPSVSSDLKPVVVLLSDGKMDPSPARGTLESHMDSLSATILPALKNNAISVYTLAFSSDADRALLQHIAQSSEGINWFTPNSETIHESFADLFLSLKKPQVLALSSKGFKVEANIDEATFYVNQKEGAQVRVQDPSEYVFSANELADNMRWFDSKKFSVITITSPEPGDWKILGVDPDDGFATILTNLKLVTDWPNAVPVGEKVMLRARLYEGQLPVDLQAVSEAVSFAFQITPSDRVSEPIIREFLSDEAKSGDETAGDGVFSQELKIDQPGEYRLRVLAKGPTFERQLQIPFRVRPPLVQLDISDHASAAVKDSHATHETVATEADSHAASSSGHASDSEHGKDSKNKVIKGSNAAVFEVSLNEEVSTFRDIKVTIVAIDSKRNKYTIEAKVPKSDSSHEQETTAKHEAEHTGSHEDSHTKDKKHTKTESLHKSADSSLLYVASATALPADGVYEIKAILEAKSRDGKAVEEESEIIKFNRKTTIDLSQMQVEVKPKEEEVEQKVEVKESVVDILSLILVSILNIGLGAGLFFPLKKSSTAGASSGRLDLPQESEELKNKISMLEKLILLDSVDSNDPRFKQASGESASVDPGNSESEQEVAEASSEEEASVK